jgi:hypothetical protein
VCIGVWIKTQAQRHIWDGMDVMWVELAFTLEGGGVTWVHPVCAATHTCFTSVGCYPLERTIIALRVLTL